MLTCTRDTQNFPKPAPESLEKLSKINDTAAMVMLVWVYYL